MVFADRLIARARALGHPLCVGLDPFAERIPRLFGPRGEPATAEAFFTEALARVAGKAVCVKPQIGLFEPWGADGVGLVARLCAAARAHDLPVILDAKRGDIGSTAEGYAAATLGPAPGMDADCVTVNPYMGLDTLAPFLDRAHASGKGVAVLVRTSNPGAGDVQDLMVEGAPLWTHVAAMLAPAARRLRGESGFSGLMIVAGATWPDDARRLRALLPDALFLVPGYGAQGGGAADAVAGFVRGPKGLEGGVVNSSRGVLYPPAAEAAASLSAWREAFDEGLAAAIADLSAAVA